MSLHEVRLSDNHTAMLGPVARYFGQDPAALIEENIVDLYSQYQGEKYSRDGCDFASEYPVEPDYDPGHLDADNIHVIELPDIISSFFASEVGNPVPVEGRAIDRRFSLIAQDIVSEYDHIGAVE